MDPPPPVAILAPELSPRCLQLLGNSPAACLRASAKIMPSAPPRTNARQTSYVRSSSQALALSKQLDNAVSTSLDNAVSTSLDNAVSTSLENAVSTSLENAASISPNAPSVVGLLKPTTPQGSNARLASCTLKTSAITQTPPAHSATSLDPSGSFLLRGKLGLPPSSRLHERDQTNTVQRHAHAATNSSNILTAKNNQEYTTTIVRRVTTTTTPSSVASAATRGSKTLSTSKTSAFDQNRPRISGRPVPPLAAKGRAAADYEAVTSHRENRRYRQLSGERLLQIQQQLGGDRLKGKYLEAERSEAGRGEAERGEAERGEAERHLKRERNLGGGSPSQKRRDAETPMANERSLSRERNAVREWEGERRGREEIRTECRGSSVIYKPDVVSVKSGVRGLVNASVNASGYQRSANRNTRFAQIADLQNRLSTTKERATNTSVLKSSTTATSGQRSVSSSLGSRETCYVVRRPGGTFTSTLTRAANSSPLHSQSAYVYTKSWSNEYQNTVSTAVGSKTGSVMQSRGRLADRAKLFDRTTTVRPESQRWSTNYCVDAHNSTQKREADSGGYSVRGAPQEAHKYERHYSCTRERIQDSRNRVQDSRNRVQDSRNRVQDSRERVQDSRERVQDSRERRSALAGRHPSIGAGTRGNQLPLKAGYRERISTVRTELRGEDTAGLLGEHAAGRLHLDSVRGASNTKNAIRQSAAHAAATTAANRLTEAPGCRSWRELETEEKGSSLVASGLPYRELIELAQASSRPVRTVTAKPRLTYTGGGPTIGPRTSGPRTSGPRTSGPATSGPATSGPATSGPQTSGASAAVYRSGCSTYTSGPPVGYSGMAETRIRTRVVDVASAVREPSVASDSDDLSLRDIVCPLNFSDDQKSPPPGLPSVIGNKPCVDIPSDLELRSVGGNVLVEYANLDMANHYSLLRNRLTHPRKSRMPFCINC